MQYQNLRKRLKESKMQGNIFNKKKTKQKVSKYNPVIAKRSNYSW
jgi:predicted phage tail protein